MSYQIVKIEDSEKELNSSESWRIMALELKALYKIAQLIGSAMHLEATLYKVLQVLHDNLNMDRATLVLLDDSGRRLNIRASYGLSKDEEKRGVYKLNEGICGKIFQTGAAFVVPNIGSEPLFLNRTRARNNIEKERLAFIGVPVMLSQQVVGVLTVDRLFATDVSFHEDIRFLTIVATLIAQFLDLNQAINRQKNFLIEENRSLKAQLKNHYNRHNIMGQSKIMQEVFLAIEKVAASDATVLLLGESGTGKELVARAIHNESNRRDRPFIKINCAALPETLLESELLGHEKGAFTGAVAAKKGRFELADTGTLFLDEIGELPLSLQAKLLRVLQEQQFERLGGTKTISVNVRLIAATNRSLEEAIARGNFRTDLYYRLNVVPIHLPPLRHRQEDIPLLIEYFLKRSNKRNKRNLIFSKEVLEFLVNYSWPGNVRELQNLVERLVIMTDGPIVKLRDLPSYMIAVPEAFAEQEFQPHDQSLELRSDLAVQKSQRDNFTPVALKELERREIESALRRHGWVQARAAKDLGLTQRQIGYRIKKYGIRLPGRKRSDLD